MAVPEEAHRWTASSVVWDINRMESIYIQLMGINWSLTNAEAVFPAEWHSRMT